MLEWFKSSRAVGVAATSIALRAFPPTIAIFFAYKNPECFGVNTYAVPTRYYKRLRKAKKKQH